MLCRTCPFYEVYKIRLRQWTVCKIKHIYYSHSDITTNGNLDQILFAWSNQQFWVGWSVQQKGRKGERHVKLCYEKRNGETFTESWNMRENKTEIDLTQYLTLWALMRTVSKKWANRDNRRHQLRRYYETRSASTWRKVSYCGGLGSIWGQSVWDLWW